MLIIIVLVVLSTFEYLKIMIGVWKYEYDMWSLNELSDCTWWLGNFVDYGCIVNECDFEWVIKLGTWCIACLTAPHGYLRV
jgi:hypothetical protein